MDVLGRKVVALVASAAFAVACGKSSDDTDREEDETGGTGGSSTGGSNRGGSSTGGLGGASNGGGTAGTAGSGAMRGYQPPDRHLQGCDRLCEREQAAMCTNETTLEECVSDCRVGILFEPCAALMDPLFECTNTTTVVECSAQGTAAMPECVAPYLDLLVCIDMSRGLEPECTAHCASEVEPACPNGDTAEDCVDGCTLIPGAFPLCTDLLETYLACGADAEHTCDEDGEPVAIDCLSPQLLFYNCLVTEYPLVP